MALVTHMRTHAHTKRKHWEIPLQKHFYLKSNHIFSEIMTSHQFQLPKPLEGLHWHKEFHWFQLSQNRKKTICKAQARQWEDWTLPPGVGDGPLAIRAGKFSKGRAGRGLNRVRVEQGRDGVREGRLGPVGVGLTVPTCSIFKSPLWA